MFSPESKGDRLLTRIYAKGELLSGSLFGGTVCMPLTLLVADDDLGIRVAVGDYLEALGYAVTTAANGRLALDAIDKIHPHLLVLDISMPEMSGYELVRQVRLEPITRLLPVVFLTERNDTADRILGYQAGCDSYLAKPFELDELGAIVQNLLDRAQIVTDWRQSSPQSPTSSNTIVVTHNRKDFEQVPGLKIEDWSI